MPLSLRYGKGDGTTSYFPLSAITDRLYARNQLILNNETNLTILEHTTDTAGYTDIVLLCSIYWGCNFPRASVILETGSFTN